MIVGVVTTTTVIIPETITLIKGQITPMRGISTRKTTIATDQSICTNKDIQVRTKESQLLTSDSAMRIHGTGELPIDPDHQFLKTTTTAETQGRKGLSPLWPVSVLLLREEKGLLLPLRPDLRLRPLHHSPRVAEKNTPFHSHPGLLPRCHRRRLSVGKSTHFLERQHPDLHPPSTPTVLLCRRHRAHLKMKSTTILPPPPPPVEQQQQRAD